MKTMNPLLRMLVMVAIAGCGPLANAAAPSPRIAYTEAQAATGRALYVQHCAICHGSQLEGGEAGPALRGSVFATKWGDKPLADLFEQTRRTMPVTQPGGLPRSQYADLIAYILYGNGHPAGSTTLLPDAAMLAQVLPATPAGAAPVALPGAGTAAAKTAWPAVADTEWLHHRGDAGSTNYSPLDQIDRGNVSRLAVAWRWRSDNFGASIWPNYEATPLMADGVLYTTAGASRSVVAIDARTGETLWMYRIDEGARARLRRARDRVAAWRCGAMAIGRRCSDHARLPAAGARCEDRPAGGALRHGRASLI